MNYIGIDIGGMSIKGGIITEKGEWVAKEVVTTDPRADEDIIIEVLANLCKSLIKKAGLTEQDICGIGLGIPGTVFADEGRVRFAPNINLVNTPLVAKLSKHFKFQVPIKISNDANCATLGEALFGGGKGKTDVLMVTLGTGVGTGFIIDGNLFEGINSAGAEGGHMVIRTSGEKCSCGRKGCWEAYASATALIRQTNAAIKKNPESILAKVAIKQGEVNGKTAFFAAEQGCKVAKSVLRKYLNYVGEGMVNLINIFRPQVFIVGGGISREGDNIIKPLQSYVNRHSYAPKYSPKVKVVPATLFNDAGILGAAALLMK
jgi:glucokinase